MILDEAQNIKNQAARQTQSIKRLQSGQKIALTGTPVENRLSELWSIMDFLNPGYLGSFQSFRKNFVLPIEKYKNKSSSEALRSIIQPFVLRRLKTDPTVIQDLPEKMEMRVNYNLTAEQASLYAAVVEEMLSRIESLDGIERRGHDPGRSDQAEADLQPSRPLPAGWKCSCRPFRKALPSGGDAL